MVGSCWLLPGPRWVDPSLLGFGAWASSSPPAPSAPQDSGLKVPQGPKQKSPCLQHLKTRTWYSHPCRRAVRSSLDLDSWNCSSFGFFFFTEDSKQEVLLPFCTSLRHCSHQHLCSRHPLEVCRAQPEGAVPPALGERG